MSCTHLADFARLRPPRLADSVHREECTQCFDDQNSPHGVDVCLTCFNGGCPGSERHHARTHAAKTGHQFVLNVKRRPKPSANREQSDEPPTKMAKLAIVAEREEDKYEHTTTFKCYLCDPAAGREIPELASSPEATALKNEIMISMSSGRQSEVQAWEEELTACEHTLMLEQLATGPIEPSGLAHCGKCELKENLWLCLTCGSLGCGRQQYGGIGGNGHGLNHFEETRHPVSVKLGTITPEGGADVYCYACNEERTDPELASHLGTFGINVQTQTKTEKSMTELQIEHNLKFDFSMTSEDGKALEPVFGAGLTGLSNLGNSCYMASVIQTVFSLEPFQKSYQPTADSHWSTCTEALPATCLQCQMHKLADGLLSGRYSHPRPTSAPSDPQATNPLAHKVPEDAEGKPAVAFQEGIRPTGFKALVGKGHAEFATMRQQDAEEFFGYLLDSLRRDAKKRNLPQEALPTEVFRFGLEQRLQCRECKGVRYRTDGADAISTSVPAREKGKSEDGTKTVWEDVELLECVGAALGDESLEYKCPRCAKNVIATKATRMATFPDVLVIHAKKFQLINWVPSKLDIPVILPPDDLLNLDPFIGKGAQEGEDILPEEQAEAPGLPEFNTAALEQLLMMGFPEIRCKKALLATGNSDPEAAMEWLFAHMEDPDIDAPLAAPQAAGGKPEPSAEQVSMLADMGFTPAQARKALRETDGNAERAIEWLFSHPDDTGVDDTPAAAPTAEAPKPALGGSVALPAHYRLKAFVSHKGPSVHSGHYVAHIRVQKDGGADDGWVLFNDEKVVKADAEGVKELKKFAYLYVFEKV